MKKTAQIEVEKFFAHAVAFDQRGRAKNIISVHADECFIMNYDKTIIAFTALKRHKFAEEITFNASDYDSEDFTIENGKVVFKIAGKDFERKKYCSIPGITFKDISDQFFRFDELLKDDDPSFEFTKDDLTLLDENLSHIEFISKDREIIILQRDIFSGTLIEIIKKPSTGFGVKSNEKLSADIIPLGIRTVDFYAMFSFSDKIKITFPDDDLFHIQSGVYEAFVGGCIYDDLGELNQK